MQHNPTPYSEQMDIARRVQEGLLAVTTPEIEGLKIVKRCVAADKIGGDFYTFTSHSEVNYSTQTSIPGVVQLTDRRENFIHIVLGDVAGHGVSSALIMALCSGLFHQTANQNRTSGQVLAATNNVLIPYISQTSVHYVTSLCLTFYPMTKQLLWSTAGHPTPVLYRKGEIIRLEGNGLFLGVYPDEPYDEYKVALESGDRILLFTDGLTEAMDHEHHLFSEEGLETLFLSLANLPLQEAMEGLFTHVQSFSSDKPKDDQTVILLEVL